MKGNRFPYRRRHVRFKWFGGSWNAPKRPRGKELIERVKKLAEWRDECYKLCVEV